MLKSKLIIAWIGKKTQMKIPNYKYYNKHAKIMSCTNNIPPHIFKPPKFGIIVRNWSSLPMFMHTKIKITKHIVDIDLQVA